MTDILAVAEEASFIQHDPPTDTHATIDGHVADVEDVAQIISKEDTTDVIHTDVAPVATEDDHEETHETSEITADEDEKDASLAVDDVIEDASVEFPAEEGVRTRAETDDSHATADVHVDSTQEADATEVTADETVEELKTQTESATGDATEIATKVEEADIVKVEEQSATAEAVDVLEVHVESETDVSTPQPDHTSKDLEDTVKSDTAPAEEASHEIEQSLTVETDASPSDETEVASSAPAPEPSTTIEDAAAVQDEAIVPVSIPTQTEVVVDSADLDVAAVVVPVSTKEISAADVSDHVPTVEAHDEVVEASAAEDATVLDEVTVDEANPEPAAVTDEVAPAESEVPVPDHAAPEEEVSAEDHVEEAIQEATAEEPAEHVEVVEPEEVPVPEGVQIESLVEEVEQVVEVAKPEVDAPVAVDAIPPPSDPVAEHVDAAEQSVDAVEESLADAEEATSDVPVAEATDAIEESVAADSAVAESLVPAAAEPSDETAIPEQSVGEEPVEVTEEAVVAESKAEETVANGHAVSLQDITNTSVPRPEEVDVEVAAEKALSEAIDIPVVDEITTGPQATSESADALATEAETVEEVEAVAEVEAQHVTEVEPINETEAAQLETEEQVIEEAVPVDKTAEASAVESVEVDAAAAALEEPTELSVVESAEASDVVGEPSVEEAAEEPSVVEIAEVVEEPSDAPAVEEPAEEEKETEVPAVEDVAVETIVEETAAAPLNVQEISSEEPTADEPVVEGSLSEVPPVEETPLESSAVEEDVSEETVVSQVPSEEPAVAESVVTEPAVEDHLHESSLEEPVAEITSVEERVAEEPVVEADVAAEEPVADAAIVAVSSAEAPELEEDTPEEHPVETPAVEAAVFETPSVEQDAATEVAEAIIPPAEETAGEVSVEESKVEIDVTETQAHPADEVVAEEPTEADKAETSLVEEQPTVEEEAVQETVVAAAAAEAPTEEIVTEVTAVEVSVGASEETAPLQEHENAVAVDELHDTKSLTAPKSEEERPKSPWTPSYSVTTQGPGSVVPDDAAEIAELQELPPSAVPEDVPVSDATVEVPFIEIAIEGDAKVTVEIPSIQIATEADAKESEATLEEPVSVTVSDGPKSPSWVPSYSVSSQGNSPLQTAQTFDLEEPASDEVEPLPVAEVQPESEAVVEVTQQVPDVAINVDDSVSPEVVEQTQAQEEVVDSDITRDALNEDSVVPIVTITPEVGDVLTPELTAEDASESKAVEDEQREIIAEAVSKTELSKSSWISSYSVSSQGSSPLQTPHVTEDVDVAELEPLSAPVVALTLPEPAAVPAEEDAVVSPAQIVVTDSEAIEEAAPVHETQAFEPVESKESTEFKPYESVIEAVVPEVPEPPKSPWTPSYTVTRQGTSPLQSPAISEKHLLPPAALETTFDEFAEHTLITTTRPVHSPESIHPPTSILSEEPVNVSAVHHEEVQLEVHEVVEQPSIVIIESEPAVEQSSVVEDAQVAAAESTDTPAIEAQASAEDIPPRPWTPSYSVTTQGPGTLSKNYDADEDDLKKPEEELVGPIASAEAPTINGKVEPHVFPTISDSITNTAVKPSLTRLAPVNENEQIQIEASSHEEADVTHPASARARLESTTSSRFFPGGWFSSTSKVLEEGRESLDHAKGEFSKSPGASPALEVPANTPVDGEVDERARKKWCIIM